MTNEEIVELIQSGQGNKKELIFTLYNKNLALIKRMARKYAYKIEIEDALQVAYIALYNAVEKYDPAKGMLFMTFYPYALLYELRAYNYCGIVPYAIMNQVKKMNRIVERFRVEYGREPDNKYISVMMDLPETKINQLCEINVLMNMASLDKELMSSDGTLYTLADMIPDNTDMTIEESYAEKDELEHLKQDVRECVESLEYEPKTVINDYYLLDIKMADIAQKMGINERQVKAYKEKGIRELRKERRKLMKYTDRITSAVYYGGLSNFRRTETSVTERTAIMLFDSENRALEKNRKLIQQCNVL